ncbi:MAG: HAMP domain-containing protein [Clostridia bacterium]|nr:HAMP domain-containing protein [Clostridia bacterium]
MFRSIRLRFTIIYFLLVFIAMLLAGVFIVRSFEDYNLNVVSNRLDDIAQIMMSELSKIENDELEEVRGLVQESIERHADIGLREEIYIIDQKSQKILATSTENVDRPVSEVLNTGLVVEGLIGKTVEKNFELSGNVRTKDKVYPVYSKNVQIGLIYLRYDLNDIYGTLNRARRIILQAVAMSLVLSIIIGFLLSKSITDPINEVTLKAAKLAEGDFNQIVEVRSEDEIGALSKTFNFLTGELKKYISEISSEKSKLEAIINYMEDGLIAINAEGQIIHCNPKAGKLLTTDGVFNDDIIGDLLSIYSSGKLNNGIGSKSISYNLLILKVNFAPFLDESSKKMGVVFVLQDITEEERLENMRREFVANVSHELKTPLTSIKSYTETILDGAVDDPEMQKTFLEVINTEADRMARLVRDLLELSNFDSDTIRLKRERYEVNSLLDTCVLKVKATADQKRQEMVNHYKDIKIYALIDYDKIEQLVLNILSNGIKYSNEDSQIIIDLREGSDEDHFELVVTDSGIGIPDQDLNRIFERFYRVDKARSRELGGTGLGLSIAKEIAEAHGGDIRIDSEYGVGTKVTIILPYGIHEV